MLLSSWPCNNSSKLFITWCLCCHTNSEYNMRGMALSVCLLHHQWFRSSFVCRQSAHLPQVKKYDLAVLLLLSSTCVQASCDFQTRRLPNPSCWLGSREEAFFSSGEVPSMCCFMLCGMWKTARGPIPPKCPVIVNTGKWQLPLRSWGIYVFSKSGNSLFAHANFSWHVLSNIKIFLVHSSLILAGFWVTLTCKCLNYFLVFLTIIISL